jgi:Uma2 family endonuclease
MSPTIATDDERNVFSDLLDELGGISPDRIILRPPPGTATEDDVIKMLGAPRKRICELIDGVLVEKPMGFKESALAVVLGSSLQDFAKPMNLGLVAGPDGTIRLWPGRVRIPDVAFISWDRIPGRRMPDKAIPEIAPDIAVEILSESNTKKEMEIKRDEYFRVGVRLVWEVDPEARTVAVYTSPADVTILGQSAILDGGFVLPGYTLPLADLFSELDRHG